MPDSKNELFKSAQINPVDEGFDLLAAFQDDPVPNKVSLGAGIYRDNDGLPWVLPIVRKVERELASSEKNNHEYLPIRGLGTFLTLTRDFVFGASTESDAQICQRISSIQTISGTGANYLGASFLAKHLQPKAVWISDPSWPNHHLVWELAGPQVWRRTYPYYNPTTKAVDFDAMIETLEREAVMHDVIVLHPCAHNPTGLDLSQDQWRQLAKLCDSKGLFPFFDSAYQGFATGDPTQDAWPVRHFMSQGFQLAVASSFSKNFGLYGERVGTLHIVTDSSDSSVRVNSELVRLQRGQISTPPSHGAKIVARILGDEQYRSEWLSDLQVMVSRLQRMRHGLYREICRLETPGQWDQVITQIGMFSYTGLKETHTKFLKEKYHIYIYSSGRISIAGLNTFNVRLIAEAIDDAIRSV